MRKEAEGNAPKEAVPHVLVALLRGLEQRYQAVPDDGELDFFVGRVGLLANT
jgi:hypothetical protein